MGLSECNPPNVLCCFGPELRNTIYDLVYQNDLSSRASLALMQASRQLHLEVSSHYYARDCFNISCPIEPTPGATILPPVNDRYLRFLKEVGIELEVGSASLPRVQETAVTIRNLTTIGAHFDKLTFLIQFPSEFSPFLRARFDDMIMDQAHPIAAAIDHVLGSKVSEVAYIILNGAWFAPGVATKLKDRYGARLQFMQANEKPSLSEISDLALCERPFTGTSSAMLGALFDSKEATHRTHGDRMAARGVDSSFTEPVLGHFDDGSEPSLPFGEEEDTKGEEELNDADDVDMEAELVAFGDGELDSILDNLNETNGLIADETRMNAELEFLVAFAPQLLFPSSGES